jgi:hypothetical protein
VRRLPREHTSSYGRTQPLKIQSQRGPIRYTSCDAGLRTVSPSGRLSGITANFEHDPASTWQCRVEPANRWTNAHTGTDPADTATSCHGLLAPVGRVGRVGHLAARQHPGLRGDPERVRFPPACPGHRSTDSQPAGDPDARRLDAVTAALAAGCDLLHTHAAARPDGSRLGRSEWVGMRVLSSRPRQHDFLFNTQRPCSWVAQVGAKVGARHQATPGDVQPLLAQVNATLGHVTATVALLPRRFDIRKAEIMRLFWARPSCPVDGDACNERPGNADRSAKQQDQELVPSRRIRVDPCCGRSDERLAGPGQIAAAYKRRARDSDLVRQWQRVGIDGDAQAEGRRPRATKSRNIGIGIGVVANQRQLESVRCSRRFLE